MKSREIFIHIFTYDIEREKEGKEGRRRMRKGNEAVRHRRVSDE